MSPSYSSLILAVALSGLPGVADAQEPSGTAPVLASPADNHPRADGVIDEPRFIARAIDFANRTIGDRNGQKSGFFPELSNMVTGAGFISAGPGYRQWFGGDRLVLDASAAWSWRSYKMAQAHIEWTNLAHSRVVIGSQARWQDLTQVTYFGEGAESLDANRSEYRLTSLNVVGYTTFRPAKWLAVTGRAGFLHRPELRDAAGTFKRGSPDTSTVFPDDIVYSLAEQPNFLHGEASITAETRDHRSHPTDGGLYRAAWSHYSDRTDGLFTFQRLEGEAAHFVPVANGKVVFAVHGWTVATGTSENSVVPFYLMPSLGGGNTLRAFTDYRFHDRNLLLATAEARLALFTHIDVAAFVDAGNVAARFSDLDLAQRSYGLGLRMHSDSSTFARVDAAHGRDGWRILFRMTDPLHLTRVSRRTAALPFVP